MFMPLLWHTVTECQFLCNQIEETEEFSIEVFHTGKDIPLLREMSAPFVPLFLGNCSLQPRVFS